MFFLLTAVLWPAWGWGKSSLLSAKNRFFLYYFATRGLSLSLSLQGKKKEKNISRASTLPARSSRRSTCSPASGSVFAAPSSVSLDRGQRTGVTSNEVTHSDAFACPFRSRSVHFAFSSPLIRRPDASLPSTREQMANLLPPVPKPIIVDPGVLIHRHTQARSFGEFAAKRRRKNGNSTPVH